MGAPDQGMANMGAVLTVAGLMAGCVDKADLPRELAGADAARGLELIRAEGCAACHHIPGVDWPSGRVGGSLAGVGARPMIAGRIPNQPAEMIAFLRDAPSVAPDIAMPASGLTPEQARDVAAYLYARDGR